MRVVVTGAGGFLGLNLVRGLVARGHQVLALDRAFTDRAVAVLREVPVATTATVDVLDPEGTRRCSPRSPRTPSFTAPL